MFLGTLVLHALVAWVLLLVADRVLPLDVRDALWKTAGPLSLLTAAVAVHSPAWSTTLELQGLTIPAQALTTEMAQQPATRIAPWLLVSLVLGAYELVQLIRLHRWVAASPLLDDPRATAMLARIRTHAGLGPIELRACTDRSPAAWNRTILLPERILDLDDDALFGVLAHEAAHLARRDGTWAVVLSVWTTCVPVHPLLWLARVHHRRLAEPLADDLAVRWGARPRTLARTMTHVASWGLRTPLASPMAQSQLHQRVTRLLSSVRRVPHRSLRWSMVCLVPALLLAMPRLGAATPGLSRDAIDNGIRPAMPSLRYCYQQELAKRPELAGTVVVSFAIGGDGRVRSAEVARTTMHNSLVEDCIVDRFEGLTFDAFGHGTIQVRYPIAFAPG